MSVCRRIFTAVLLAGLALADGCGRQDVSLHPLRGKVLFNGKPTPKAELVFHPLFQGPGWMPIAVVGEDGSFDASTKVPGDGALPGRYKVTVVWYPKATDDEKGPNFLPARYSQQTTSDLVVEAGPELAILQLKN